MPRQNRFQPRPTLGAGRALAITTAAPGALADHERAGTILNRLVDALDRADPARLGPHGASVRAWAQETRRDQLLDLLEKVIQHGDQAAAVHCAHQLADHLRASGTSLPEGMAEALRPLLSSLLFLVGDHPVADDLAAAVIVADPRPETRRDLWHVTLLRDAWTAIHARDAGAAVRRAWSVVDDPDATLDLGAEARLVRGEGYRGLGDEEREASEREEWYTLFQGADYLRGPVDFAAATENASTSLGPVAEERLEQLLRSASRLATLRERRANRTGAQEIYRHLLDQGHHDWVDPTMPCAGTIRERARHGSAETLPRLVETATPHLQLHRPAREYGRVERDEAERAVANLLGDHDGDQAIELDAIDIHENRFRLTTHEEGVTATLARCIDEAAREGVSALLGLDARPVEVRNGHPGARAEQWLLVSHGVKDHGLQGLVFGIRPVVVGHEVELALSALFMPAHEDDPSTRQRVVSLLTSRLTEVPGFRALQDRVVDTVIKAGRQLGNGAAPAEKARGA